MIYRARDVTLRSKEKDLGDSVISLSNNGDCLLMDENGMNIKGCLNRAKVEWMQKAGFVVSGFEDAGSDKQGRSKYLYKEWYFAYKE